MNATTAAADDPYDKTAGDPHYKVPLPTRARLTTIQKRIIDMAASGAGPIRISCGYRGTSIHHDSRAVYTNSATLYALTHGTYPLLACASINKPLFVLTEWGRACARAAS